MLPHPGKRQSLYLEKKLPKNQQMVKKRDPGSLNLPAGGDPPIREPGMLQGHRIFELYAIFLEKRGALTAIFRWLMKIVAQKMLAQEKPPKIPNLLDFRGLGLKPSLMKRQLRINGGKNPDIRDRCLTKKMMLVGNIIIISGTRPMRRSREGTSVAESGHR